MTYTAEELYELLPAIYRIRDADGGLPLKGLMAVLAGQADVVDADVERLYDNWFAETCDPWVVPYIGALLRARPLAPVGTATDGRLSALPRSFSARAYVANTIRYRRRKGTPAVLEQVAFDVSGWRARVVEFFQLLSTTQYAKHIRAANVRTPDLRDGATLALLGGPFDRIPHTAEVRPIDLRGDRMGRTPADRGRYNIPNVGLYVWRLQSYPVSRGTARPAGPAGLAGFTFDPLGLDIPLFNSPRTEDDISHLAEEPDVPGALRRRALRDELEGLRQAMVDGREAALGFFRDEAPAVRIRFQTAPDPAPFTDVDPAEIAICDLGQWRRPSATRRYLPTDGGPEQLLPIRVGVDPERGRLAFSTGNDPLRVQVSYAHGFSGDLGSGPYDRRDAVARWLDPDAVSFQRGVTQDDSVAATASDPALLVKTVRQAVADWNAFAATTANPIGVITVMDSGTYADNLTGPTFGIQIPAGARLAIVAAGWPDEVVPGTAGPPTRTLGRISAEDLVRPHLRGNVSVRGGAAATSPNPGELIIDGLLIEGPLTVLSGNLGRLTLLDTTIVPGAGGVTVNVSASGQQNAALRVSLDRCITGPLTLPDPVPELHIADSVVGAETSSVTVDAPAAAADLQRCTVFGSVKVRAVEAGNAIFGGPLTSRLTQEGCVRFCHVAEGSHSPRRFRCQPDLALADVVDPDVAERIRRRVTPAFTSVRYGDPGYAQLGRACAEEILTGAEDGSEMGAFNSLGQPQRLANLRLAVDELLPFGLEVGVFFVT